MWNTSRGLRETVIRAMAKVGLVWAVAVLGALFMATSAQSHQDDAYSLSSATAGAHSAAVSVASGDAPRTAGLALALVVLGGGVIVLAVGASRERVVLSAQVRRRAGAGLGPGLGPPARPGLRRRLTHQNAPDHNVIRGDGLAVAVGFEAAATAVGQLRTFEDKAGL